MIDILTVGCGIRGRRGFLQASATAVADESIVIIAPMSTEQPLDEELVARYRLATEAGEREECVNQ